nr:hypothetical protein [uncultured Mediterranean phage uvMED]|tara:strand:+ start:38080 stop:38379 length:300 start_codon:yes stop_codon:yes gene_type:complete
MARIVTKKTARTRSVQSVKPVSNLEELADVSITGAPGSSLDGHLLSFDAASNTFVLISPDEYLLDTVTDGDIPDPFVTQLESELDLGNVQIDNLDGGEF